MFEFFLCFYMCARSTINIKFFLTKCYLKVMNEFFVRLWPVNMCLLYDLQYFLQICNAQLKCSRTDNLAHWMRQGYLDLSSDLVWSLSCCILTPSQIFIVLVPGRKSLKEISWHPQDEMEEATYTWLRRQTKSFYKISIYNLIEYHDCEKWWLWWWHGLESWGFCIHPCLLCVHLLSNLLYL